VLLQVCRVSLEPAHLVLEVAVALLLVDVVGRSCKGTSTRNQLCQPGMRPQDMCSYLAFVGDCKDKCHMYR